MKFEELEKKHVEEISKMYVKSFNMPPWNEEWTVETASKRILQIMSCDASYGLAVYEDSQIVGMILGYEEQFYNGILFQIKEFCVDINKRKGGLGTEILKEFEKRVKQRGADGIILYTSRDDSTEGFYRRRGLYYCEDIIMMSKRL